MNSTISLKPLVSSLAKSKGWNERFAEKFITDFFKTVEEGLRDSKSVTVKGFGRFVLCDDGEIRFAPDESVESRVNEPFECFEPIELSDDDINDLNSTLKENTEDNPNITELTVISDETPQTPTDSVIPDITDDLTDNQANVLVNHTVNMTGDDNVSVASVDNGDDIVEQISESDSEVAEQIDDVTVVTVDECEDKIIDDEITATADITVQDTDVENDISLSENNSTTDIPNCNDSLASEYLAGEEYDDYRRPRRRRILWFIIGLICGLIIGASTVYLAFKNGWIVINPHSSSDNDISLTIGQTDKSDDGLPLSLDNEINVKVSAETGNSNIVISTAADGETPSDIVTETVTRTNYLAAMARRHYGRFEFWVYIYDENRDKLDNPDLIEPNTVVVIPPAAKYGIDKDDPESVSRALKRSQEIYAQFKK